MTHLNDAYYGQPNVAECVPCTEDGIRKLALIAVEFDVPNLRDYLDGLELLMLRILRISPEGIGRDHFGRSKAAPINITHRRRFGIVVEWRIDNAEKCDACCGKGTLRASGCNGERYTVDCPECDGSGEGDGDPEFIKTDIDGKPLKRAA